MIEKVEIYYRKSLIKFQSEISERGGLLAPLTKTRGGGLLERGGGLLSVYLLIVENTKDLEAFGSSFGWTCSSTLLCLFSIICFIHCSVNRRLQIGCVAPSIEVGQWFHPDKSLQALPLNSSDLV